MKSELEQLREQLAAMTQERDESRRAHQNDLDKLRQEEAYSQQLREALEDPFTVVVGHIGFRTKREVALELPSDNRALIRACKLYAAEQLSRIVKFSIAFSIPKIAYEVLEKEAAQLRKEAI